MSVKLVIKPEPGSASFAERSICVDPGVSVSVCRASRTDKPGTDNGIFQCKVRLVLTLVVEVVDQSQQV